MGISEWLKKSSSKFLSFWGTKTNRTTIQNLMLEQGKTSKQIQVPFGTWSWSIYGSVFVNQGKTYTLLMEGGHIRSKAVSLQSGDLIEKHIFNGVPYVERQDRFKIKNTSNEDICFHIIYHRIQKENS